MISCNFENSDLGSHDIKILTLLHSKKTSSQQLLWAKNLVSVLVPFLLLLAKGVTKTWNVKIL